MVLTKRVRFEVFKRDGFCCQYCGRTPPEVILEIDHIKPKANGGEDVLHNYITACFDCNRGKSNITLDIVPKTVTNHFVKLRERREQLKAYNKFLLKLEGDLNLSISKVNDVFNSFSREYELSDQFQNTSVRTFLNHLPEVKVIEAMKLACQKFSGNLNNSDKALQYFCGICWNWIKRPETRGW